VSQGLGALGLMLPAELRQALVAAPDGLLPLDQRSPTTQRLIAVLRGLQQDFREQEMSPQAATALGLLRMSIMQCPDSQVLEMCQVLHDILEVVLEDGPRVMLEESGAK
jgi:hypothetical protein